MARWAELAEESLVERPACCPEPWSSGSADVIELATVVEMPALLAETCEHTLTEIDARQRHWDEMRPKDRDPRWYPLPPLRLAIAAEYARRGLRPAR